MARAGRNLLAEHGLAYLTTTRADGSRRVHPVVPVLADGDLFVAISDWSPKRRDLRSPGWKPARSSSRDVTSRAGVAAGSHASSVEVPPTRMATSGRAASSSHSIASR